MKQAAGVIRAQTLTPGAPECLVSVSVSRKHAKPIGHVAMNGQMCVAGLGSCSIGQQQN